MKGRLLLLQQKLFAQGMLYQAGRVMHLLTTGKVTTYLFGDDFFAEWELKQLGVKHFSWFNNTYSTTFTI